MPTQPDGKNAFFTPKAQTTLEVFLAFLWLGLTAFGGPAAHIGMFQREFVIRRKWLTNEHFLDLLGATNLIPGPNSTEMAIHIGYLRAGWRGLLAGGLGFTIPAVAIVLALAWGYARYGTTPQVEWLLYGVKPVLIAIIFQALWELRRKAIKDTLTALIAIGVIAGYFLGINELLLLIAGGLTLLLVKNASRLTGTRSGMLPLLLPLLAPVGSAVAAYSPLTLFLVFLKIGAILYGSGYVLIAFLRADLVERLGWLTEQQLIDAIAIGQVTPGPLFTTATFIGYQMGGISGALIATLGIFLPSYIFVAISNPVIPRLRRSMIAGSLLDGVIVASLGMMAAVAWQLGRASVIDLPTAVLAALSLYIVMKYRVNATWLILLGALAGLALSRFA